MNLAVVGIEMVFTEAWAGGPGHPLEGFGACVCFCETKGALAAECAVSDPASQHLVDRQKDCCEFGANLSYA